MVNFLNFATLRPDISKTGGDTKKIIYSIGIGGLPHAFGQYSGLQPIPGA